MPTTLPEAQATVPLGTCKAPQRGPLRVIARYGNEVDVATANDGTLRVRLRRRSDDVVCGDLVCLEAEEDAVRMRVFRHNELTRRDPSGKRRTIAANVDRVWIVIAPQPEVPRFLIDRFLAGIFNLGASPGLLVNKWDPGGKPARQAVETLLADYRCLKLPVLRVSAHTREGLDRLHAAARGGSNILVGQSGVGKSSLIQALLPDEVLRVGHLGQTGEGRHTTTTARWYTAEDDGAAWIDSPGIRDFTPEIGSRNALERGFPDLAAAAEQCRFRNCRHLNEPGCAVTAASAAGELPPKRLKAWQELLAEVPDP